MSQTSLLCNKENHITAFVNKSLNKIMQSFVNVIRIAYIKKLSNHAKDETLLLFTNTF